MLHLHQLPAFSERDVRAALNNLIYLSPTRRWPSPLLELALVEQICAVADFPNTSLKRHLALSESLTALIRDAYQHHRQIQGLANPRSDAPLQQALSHIAQEAVAQNLALKAWSWLYHRYVRVDLGMTPVQFAAACGIDERTLRRYAAYGIRRLTEQLILAEQQLRGV